MDPREQRRLNHPRLRPDRGNAHSARSRVVGAIVFLLFVIPFLPHASIVANEQVRITVQQGEKHTFKGLGVNGGALSHWVPQDVRESLTRLIWEDLNMTVMRFDRVYLGWDFEYILAVFKECVQLKKKFVPDLKLLFNPTGTMTSYDAWGERIAGVIDSLEDSLGYQIDYTGIGNEPNQKEYTWAAPLLSSDIPGVIKALRAALDARGLTHVKIIAPGPSNVDDYMYQAIDAVMEDPEALALLDGWEYHSYNMSIRRDVAELFRDPPKEIWQTESSIPEGDYELNDSMAAAQTCTRLLADVNVGTDYWLYWRDYYYIKIGTLGYGDRILLYNGVTGEIKPLLKYFYLRQLSRTLVPNTRMRQCVTDLEQRTGRDIDKYMEYTYGKKLPVAAAAGIRPDGSWAMAVVNHTGLRFVGYGTEYYEKADYDVTFSVEELADAGDIEFEVWRCNNGSRNVMEAQPATMRNGEITITLHHCELVCLSTTFDTEFLEIPEHNAKVTGGSITDCGAGITLTLIPPLWFRGSLAVRRRRARRRPRNRKRRS